jgi:hypothetical protein
VQSVCFGIETTVGERDARATIAFGVRIGAELTQTRDESVGIVDRERVAGSSPRPINGWGVAGLGFEHNGRFGRG